jgi:hypothetical protein
VFSKESVPRGAPEKEYIFHPNMLQLPVGGKRKTSSLQLSTREGGDAGKEIAEDT